MLYEVITSYVLGVLSMVLAMSLSLVNFPVMAQNESGASLTVTGGCNGGCNGISAVVTNHGSGDMTSAVNYEVQSRVGQDWVTVDSGTLGPLASGESQTISYNPNNVGGTYRFKIWQPAGHPGTGVLYSQACKFECVITSYSIHYTKLYEGQPHLKSISSWGNPADVRGTNLRQGLTAATLAPFLNDPQNDLVLLLLARTLIHEADLETAP